MGAVRDLSRASCGASVFAIVRCRCARASGLQGAARSRDASANQQATTQEQSAKEKATLMDTQPRLTIAMLLYPGLTLLDLIGPATVFSWFADIHLVWKTKELIYSDTGVGVMPTDSFDSCPRELDILFVPGGFG